MGTGWGLGVAAGTTSGIGLSTRRYFDSGAGVHIGAMYVYVGDHQWGNLAAQALYTLARGRKTRFYALFGAQFMFDVYDFEHTPNAKLSERWNGTLFVGPGLGLEMHFTKHFGWSIELPLHAVFALEGNDHRLAMGGPVNFLPGANTAFTFYFK